MGIGSSKALGSLGGGTLPCVLSEEAFHVPTPSIVPHAGEAQEEKVAGWWDELELQAPMQGIQKFPYAPRRR